MTQSPVDWIGDFGMSTDIKSKNRNMFIERAAVAITKKIDPGVDPYEVVTDDEGEFEHYYFELYYEEAEAVIDELQPWFWGANP